MFMTRTLRLLKSPETTIPVRVALPTQQPIDWSCHVEIDWPDGRWSCDVVGIDPIQALQLALQMIGTELYSSELHSQGRLTWLAPGAGYGFPVPRVMRDMLIGEDRKL